LLILIQPIVITSLGHEDPTPILRPLRQLAALIHFGAIVASLNPIEPIKRAIATLRVMVRHIIR
jgi:hypothetical protein